jgi:4-amino-4-deoxy-L-arabinose transferase-like glycosyltransferase
MGIFQLRQRVFSSDLAVLIVLALARILLHTLTNNQYGFHRDELAVLENARFLDWGYVVYPPLTPFLARVSLILFGTSLVGLRLFAVAAQAAAMVVTGLMAHELGGGRFAQIVAALAAAIAPVSFASGTMFQYVSFDYLWWVLIAYLVARWLQSEEARWCIAIGAAIGLGFLTKYTIAFFVAGIVAGLLFTDARRYLRTPWLWLGCVLAALICFPNLLWQIHHHFISLDFLKSIHARDVRRGATDGFLCAQLWICTNVITAPLWLAGLYYVFIVPSGKRYRMLGWMYVVPLLLFLLARGRDYYLTPAYPMLFAAGSAWGEQWLNTLPASRARIVRRSTYCALAVATVLVAAVLLPVAPASSKWWKFADKLHGNFNEEFSWPEMAEAAAHIRDSLPSEDRDHLGILVSDAGQAGAITIFGARYGLPNAISGSNTHWLRGYGNPPPATLIVIGFPHDVEPAFQSWVGHVINRYGIKNSAIGDYTDILVCRNLRLPWPEFWQRIQSFG